jgi:hypothetical protein
MKGLLEIEITKHLAGWQIVQGALGRWYRIEKDPDGHWLQRAGPYRSRQEARDCLHSDQIDEPSNWSRLMARDVGHGHHEWYVVVHVRKSRWAQMAGPFETRAEAREWLSGYKQ